MRWKACLNHCAVNCNCMALMLSLLDLERLKPRFGTSHRLPTSALTMELISRRQEKGSRNSC
ncbi:UNVERIFIED_CONTAM: hypothetical protein GTU68_057500 [Idotea baltica]|nr:hypothetical protein [Idotea baltica]